MKTLPRIAAHTFNNYYKLNESSGWESNGGLLKLNVKLGNLNVYLEKLIFHLIGSGFLNVLLQIFSALLCSSFWTSDLQTTEAQLSFLFSSPQSTVRNAYSCCTNSISGNYFVWIGFKCRWPQAKVLPAHSCGRISIRLLVSSRKFSTNLFCFLLKFILFSVEKLFCFF